MKEKKANQVIFNIYIIIERVTQPEYVYPKKIVSIHDLNFFQGLVTQSKHSLLEFLVDTD